MGDTQAPNRTCENCGLPSWAVSGQGISVVIEDKPENRFQRTRKRTVWCHNDECGIQCLGVSRYGVTTSKWPITLAQFRATKPLEPFRKPTGAGKPSRRSLEYRQTQMRKRQDTVAVTETTTFESVAC